MIPVWGVVKNGMTSSYDRLAKDDCKVLFGKGSKKIVYAFVRKIDQRGRVVGRRSLSRSIEHFDYDFAFDFGDRQG